MLHAISMPQSAPVSIYVHERLLVSLTPVEMKSCGQPLPRYPASGYHLSRLASDITCRSGTKSGDFRSRCGKRPRIGKARESGWIDRRLIDQQNGDVIPDRINPVARAALERLRVHLENKGLFAGGANQDLKQVLGNHDREIVRRKRPLSADSCQGSVLAGCGETGDLYPLAML